MKPDPNLENPRHSVLARHHGLLGEAYVQSAARRAVLYTGQDDHKIPRTCCKNHNFLHQKPIGYPASLVSITIGSSSILTNESPIDTSPETKCTQSQKTSGTKKSGVPPEPKVRTTGTQQIGI